MRRQRLKRSLRDCGRGEASGNHPGGSWIGSSGRAQASYQVCTMRIEVSVKLAKPIENG